LPAEVNLCLSTARTLRWDYSHGIPGKLETLLDKMDFTGRFAEDEWVAIKTHWGSQGAFFSGIFLTFMSDRL
jgi:uncharacterized protein